MSLSDPEFGVNGAQVRIFLAELRELDLDRALEVWEAHAIAQGQGYVAALLAAQHVAEKQRPDAWARARLGAATIARDRLGEAAPTAEIVDVLGDAAAALVVRDLLSRHDFHVLRLPWTWHVQPAGPLADEGEPVAVAPAAVVLPPVTQPPVTQPPFAPVSAAARAFVPVSAAAMVRPSPTAAAGAARPPWSFLSGRFVRAVARAGTVVATVTVLAVLTRLAPDSAIVAPAHNAQSTDAVTSDLGTPLPSLAIALESPGPPATAPGSSDRPIPTEVVAAPTPHPGPTQAPAPTPKPTPAPPTPRPTCTVISLLDFNSVKAQGLWTAAGFSSKVTFSPAVPPQYKILWQSLTAGSSVLCSNGITVSDHAQ